LIMWSQLRTTKLCVVELLSQSRFITQAHEN
jgi:hypothetical protein